MRLQQPSAHRPLTRWFTSLLNAKYGVLLGVPLAAALLTLLLMMQFRAIAVPKKEGSSGRVVLHWEADSVRSIQLNLPRQVERTSKWQGDSFYIVASGDTLHNLRAYIISGNSAGALMFHSDGEQRWRYLGELDNDSTTFRVYDPLPVTTTTTLESAVTDYPPKMTYNSANTLMAQVVRDNPSATYSSTLDYFASDTERRRLVQPISPAQSGSALSEIARLFKPGSISVVAELDATTFEKQPADEQRILFNPDAPIHFEWNIKPLEEREQDLTVKLFLEGIPLDGTEPQRIPIYATTVRIDVGVRMFSYGASIAIYTTLYAVLTFILGGLTTWGIPRVSAWAIALAGKGPPSEEPMRVRYTMPATAAATRRYNRKTPGRRRA